MAFATALCAARASGEDAWWARDKALHLGFSTGIAGVTYGTAAVLGASEARAAVIGGSVAFGLGVAKETADAFGFGDPSWKDLTWDAIGTASGVGIALGLDLLIRPRAPAAVARWQLVPTLGTRTLGLSFTLR